MTPELPQVCFEVDDEYLKHYLASALNTQILCERLGTLVAHLVDIAGPRTGGATVLVVIARLAARIGDAVEVRVYDEGDDTVLDTLIVRESSWTRPWEAVRMRVPYREFEQGVSVRPEMIKPLLAAGGSAGYVMILRSPGNREIFSASTVQMPALSVPPGVRKAEQARK